MAKRCWTRKFHTIVLKILLMKFPYHRSDEKRNKEYCFSYFLTSGAIGQFHQASVDVVQQPRLTSDLEIDTVQPMTSHLRSNYIFNRRLVGARYIPPGVVWALYAKGASEPLTSSPRVYFMTLPLISSNEECVAHQISPLQLQDYNLSSRDCGRLPP